MNGVDDYRVLTSWSRHVKRLRLRAKFAGTPFLDDHAEICLHQLWSDTAANSIARPDGELRGFDGTTLEMLVGWKGEPGAFVAALIDVELVDDVRGTLKIHDWPDHQTWANGLRKRQQRGSLGGKASGKKRKEVNDSATKRQRVANDSPTTQQPLSFPSPTLPNRTEKNLSEPSADAGQGARPVDDHQRVIDGFHTRYVLHHDGRKPTWNGITGKVIKTLLAKHPADEILRRADLFFSPNCPDFVARGGRDLKAFAAHFDKLAAAPKATTAPARAPVVNENFRGLLRSAGVGLGPNDEAPPTAPPAAPQIPPPTEDP